MHNPTAAFLLGLAVGLTATVASASQTPYGTWATGASDGFEVFGTSGGSNAFCAAGHYARWSLDARAADRVVLTVPYGPSPTQANQRSVGFVLVPQGSVSGNSFFSRTGPRGVGNNMTVSHAIWQCSRK